MLIVHTPGLAQNAPSIDQRVEDLLARMTLSEKIGQMTQINVDLINLSKDNYAYLDTAKFRESVRTYHVGSYLNGFAISAEDWYAYMSEMQRINLEESRLKIPLLYGVDHMHGASYLKGSTIFPHNLNIGGTFNDAHARAMGGITTRESADVGHNWIFAPVLDLGRDPRWPRFYETFGEDPLVASRMGTQFVLGLQDPEVAAPYQSAATAKHFLGYSTPTSGWDRSPALIPDQLLHEIHRPSFQAAIDAGIKTIMVNSGEVNGVPVHASYELLTSLLRDEMGFNGVVVTDWADIIKLTGLNKAMFQQEHYHRIAENEKEATYRSIMAGVDVSMTPMTYDFVRIMHELVEEGRISVDRIDLSVRRVLRLKFELGLFEHPMPRNDRFDRIGTPENKAKALEAARESIVLLRNEGNVLPLGNAPRQILLTGSNADCKSCLNGGWTMEWQGGNESHYPADHLTIRTALQKQFPNTKIVILQDVGVAGSSERRRFDAEASESDVVIAAVGEKPYTEFVGNLTDLTMPEADLQVMQAVKSTGMPHGWILIEGRPRVIPGALADADFVIFAGLPGFEGAQAVAEILSGKVNPSGRLSFTYPKVTGHFNPYDHKPTDHTSAKWEFGHGLSYTSFEYSDFELDRTEFTRNDEVVASVKLTNTGTRDARHSVLWYISDEIGSITRPVKQLKHYESITLAAGESKTVTFSIQPHTHLSFPDKTGQPILEEGRFTIRVGGLSGAITLK